MKIIFFVYFCWMFFLSRLVFFLLSRFCFLAFSLMSHNDCFPGLAHWWKLINSCSHSLSLTHIISITHYLSLILSYSLTLSQSNSCLSLSLSLSMSLSHTQTLYLPASLSHTLMHTLSLSQTSPTAPRNDTGLRKTKTWYWNQFKCYWNHTEL